MKSIFEETTRNEVINRIKTLNENSAAQWGKMNLHQMLRHCIMWDEVALGYRRVKQPLLSKLFGKLVLKGFVRNDSPLIRYLPAVTELKIKSATNTEIEAEKNKWISLIQQYPKSPDHTYILPFFGKVKEEEAGCLAYKHSDHHLRQFDA